jgi:YHS domain-containing protein
MAMVTDPVCGMKIDDGEAAGTAEFEGRTYSFCSEACRDAFIADPARTLVPELGSDRIAEDELLERTG